MIWRSIKSRLFVGARLQPRSERLSDGIKEVPEDWIDDINDLSENKSQDFISMEQ